MKKKMKPAKKTVKKVLQRAKLAPAPVITEKKRKKVTPADLVEVSSKSMLISIDLERSSDESIAALEIEEGQRLFPYTLAPRFLIGWQAVNFISSFEMKMSHNSPLPSMTVRFVENMSDADVKTLDPVLRGQIEQQMALVKQYPFVTVESPLLTA